MNEPINAPDVPIEGEVSDTQEALEARINDELGIPNEPAPAEPPAPEPVEDEEPDEPVEDDEPEDEEDEPAPAEPATPSDEELFIEVVDADGVTHKISKASDLPADFSFGTEANLLDTLDKLRDLKEEINQRDAEKASAETKAAKAEADQKQFAAWDKEVEDLGKSKRIDAKNTERVEAVFDHMNEINKARIEAGNPNLITSFEDALEKLEAKEARDKEATDKENDNQRAKQKSALIGRSSASAGGDRQPYRSGMYRDIDDIPV